MAKEKKYVVKKGDTLTKIGKSFGIAPDELFNHKLNAKLKKSRGKPDKIQPGDVVFIPPTGPDPKMLAGMVKSLEAQRKQRAQTIARIETTVKEMKTRFAATKKKYNKQMTGIQFAETLFFAYKDMGKMGQKMITTGKTAEEIAKANKDVLKMMGTRSIALMSPAFQKVASDAETTNSKVGTIVGKTVNAYFNLSSPSFYGSRLAILVEDGFFKKVLKGEFDGTAEDLLKAYNWDLGKELGKTAKTVEQQAGKIIADLKTADAADVALIAEIKAKMKEG